MAAVSKRELSHPQMEINKNQTNARSVRSTLYGSKSNEHLQVVITATNVVTDASSWRWWSTLRAGRREAIPYTLSGRARRTTAKSWRPSPMSLQHKAHPDRKGAALSGAALCRVYSGHARTQVLFPSSTSATQRLSLSPSLSGKREVGGSCEGVVAFSFRLLRAYLLLLFLQTRHEFSLA